MSKFETSPKNITPQFLKALIRWQSQGRRSVTIEFKPEIMDEKRKAAVFCYDHIACEGRHAKEITEIPSSLQLLEMKKARIQKERAELQKQMNEMEESE